MAFVRAKKMILLSFNRIPQINWEINNHNNNNISPRLCASVLVCVCVWKRESVVTDVQSKIRKEMMQKENHRSGQCWCMAPPSCPLTIGDVNLERYLFPPPLFFCPFHVHTILWSLWLASDAEGHYPQDKKKITNGHAARELLLNFVIYLCTVVGSHT